MTVIATDVVSMYIMYVLLYINIHFTYQSNRMNIRCVAHVL